MTLGDLDLDLCLLTLGGLTILYEASDPDSLSDDEELMIGDVRDDNLTFDVAVQGRTGYRGVTAPIDSLCNSIVSVDYASTPHQVFSYIDRKTTTDAVTA